MSIDLIVFLLFILSVAAFILYDRKNVKLTGLVLMRRTQRGKVWLERLSTRWPRFWNVLATLGVVVAIPIMIFISYFILSNTIQLVSGQPAGAVKIVLPWSGFEDRPGVLFVPWYFWVVGIALVVIPHEFSHGIACKISKIKIKSLGWMLLLFIPGAFVDPDARQLKKAKRFAQLKVYAAGSFANFVVGALCFVIGLALLAVLFTQNGIMPAGVIQDSPAAAANLSGALVAINGIAINSQDDLIATLRNVPIGSQIDVQTTSGDYFITTIKHPELDQAYLGVAGPYQLNYEVRADVASAGFGDTARFLQLMFWWLQLISIGIGMFNLLPIKPLDGGLVFEVIAGRFLKRDITRIVTLGVSLVLVAAVVLSIVGPAVMQ